MSIESLLGQWDGEELIVRFDRETTAWIIIAIHSTRLGPAAGGTRMKTYPDLEAAVADALGLAEGMSYKFAVVGFPWGGAKGVIRVPPQLEESARRELLRRYGELVQQLGGLFQTGPDVGSSSNDMDIIAETASPYVYGRTAEAGGAGDSGPPTALGVFHGIRATCEHRLGDSDLSKRTVAVQGAGSVGSRLAALLKDAGARVLISDIDASALQVLQRELDVEVIEPETVYDVDCDVFAPCALGGVINQKTIPRLKCGAVAGSANNQLASDADAERLRERGILYAPDFIINSGGAIWLTGRESMSWSKEETESRITEAALTTLARAFSLADEKGITTVAAARLIAEEKLARG